MAVETDKQQRARFEAEADMRTLVDAEKIKLDKPRMAAAMKMAKEQRTAIDKVKGG